MSVHVQGRLMQKEAKNGFHPEDKLEFLGKKKMEEKFSLLYKNQGTWELTLTMNQIKV